ncbi:MAG TPA: AgmX/PglI C-terminal domain-containing protein, partial [Polyangiaceae bacterium]|nr:AgmX/PglI C-terminal domain-containing protein [Polyangiaceae bacterium]
GVFTRSAACFWAFVSLSALPACLPPSETPPAAPTNQPASTSEERAPLPPEEQAPEETPTESAPAAEAKPVEPGITPTGAPTRGTLPKAVIDEKLKSAAPAIQACYERALKSKPELRGNVIVNFVVAPDGKVAHAEAAEGDDALSDVPTVTCILGEIRKLVFPEPKGGRVFINYPLKLEPPTPAAP